MTTKFLSHENSDNTKLYHMLLQL